MTGSLLATLSACTAYDRTQYDTLLDARDLVTDTSAVDAAIDRADGVTSVDAMDAPGDAADVVPDVDAGCSSNANCSATPATPVCDRSTGTCIVCTPTDRGACSATEYCTASNRCAPGCAGDGDCASSMSGRHCNAATHTCVQCVGDAECSPGSVCGGDGQCHAGCSPSQPCAGSLTCCAGACVDTTSDASNCGSCASRCSAVNNGSSVCRASSCAIGTCASGYGDCNGTFADGCETDLLADVAHCGTCAMQCRLGHATPTCSAGMCAVATCDPGFADCDGVASNGCEADLANDANHCGSCATRCTSGLCGTSLTAFAGVNSPNWNFNGMSFWDTTSNTAVASLPNVGSQANTIVYANPIVADTFTVTFDARIDINAGSRADGLMFIIESDGPTAVGLLGGGLGAVGLHGFGFELDDYNNGSCGDVDSNHAGIDDLTSCGGGMVPTAIAASVDLGDPTIGVGDIADGVWRTIRVRVVAGVMSARIGTVDVPGLQDVALPGYVPGTPWYFGFSSGTGGLAARHEVRNVTITVPSAQCL